MAREPHELQEIAWGLIDEILTEGKMTLQNGISYVVDKEAIVHLSQWLATAKAKKPRHVSVPEDFVLKKTGGEED